MTNWATNVPVAPPPTTGGISHSHAALTAEPAARIISTGFDPHFPIAHDPIRVSAIAPMLYQVIDKLASALVNLKPCRSSVGAAPPKIM